MVQCPKCSTDVASPVKTWPVISRKQIANDEKAKLIVGIFECPNCHARFRSAIDAKLKVDETASVKSMVERIKGIRGELMQTLRNLREKISTLETERSALIEEIDKLRKVAESRVMALENEVRVLREEVKGLKDILGYTEQEQQ